MTATLEKVRAYAWAQHAAGDHEYSATVLLLAAYPDVAEELLPYTKDYGQILWYDAVAEGEWEGGVDILVRAAAALWKDNGDFNVEIGKSVHLLDDADQAEVLADMIVARATGKLPAHARYAGLPR